MRIAPLVSVATVDRVDESWQTLRAVTVFGATPAETMAGGAASGILRNTGLPQPAPFVEPCS